jgi:hypothetical protein
MLNLLRDELAGVRAERRRQTAAEESELLRDRQELTALADSLKIAGMLSDMNATLLDGQGDVETIASWEIDDDLDEEEEVPKSPDAGDDEEADAVTTLLSWEENGEREIAVDLVWDGESTFLQVNGIEIRQQREALEQALVEAFRDELEL